MLACCSSANERATSACSNTLSLTGASSGTDVVDHGAGDPADSSRSVENWLAMGAKSSSHAVRDPIPDV